MEEVRENENPMTNHSSQIDVPLEHEPLAKDIEASSNSSERVDKNKSKSNSMVGHTSSRLSLTLTEMVNLWGNEGGDGVVNSVGQSSRMDTIIEGYQVKPKFIPILRKILSKHGDVFKDSMVSTKLLRSLFAEVICNIISELQDKGLDGITEDDVRNMIGVANELKNVMKVNIEWLQLRLEEILEAKQILGQSGILKKEKDYNRNVIESAKRELEECEAEKKAVEVKFQSICDKETACKKKLARAENESARISQTITNAKSKMRLILNCSLEDGLL